MGTTIEIATFSLIDILSIGIISIAGAEPGSTSCALAVFRSNLAFRVYGQLGGIVDRLDARFAAAGDALRILSAAAIVTA
jgi:hypothetical protein